MICRISLDLGSSQATGPDFGPLPGTEREEARHVDLLEEYANVLADSGSSSFVTIQLRRRRGVALQPDPWQEMG